jgi:hypothetical protein
MCYVPRGALYPCNFNGLTRGFKLATRRDFGSQGKAKRVKTEHGNKKNIYDELFLIKKGKATPLQAWTGP